MGVIYLPDPNAEFQKQMLQQSREHYERSRPGGTDDQDKMKALLGQQALSDAQYSAEQRRINDPIAAANTAAEQARATQAEARATQAEARAMLASAQNTETHNAALKASQAAVAAEEKRVAREAALRTAGSYKFNDAPPNGFQLPPTSLFSSMPDMNLGAEARQAPGALPATGFRLPQWTSPSSLPQMPDMDLGAEAGRATGTLPPVSALNRRNFADLGDGARNALQSRVAQDFPKAGPIKGTEMQRAWDDEQGALGVGGNRVLTTGEGPGGLTSSGDTPAGQEEKERIAQAEIDAALAVAANKPKTEAQMKALAQLLNMADATGDMRTLEKGYDPSGAVPMMDAFKSLDRQKYEAAAGNWIMSILRLESGGAVTDAEIASYTKYFIPSLVDSPEMVAFKAGMRADKEAAIAQGYGISEGGATGRLGPMPKNFPQPKGEGAAAGGEGAAAGGEPLTFDADGKVVTGSGKDTDPVKPPPATAKVTDKENYNPEGRGALPNLSNWLETSGLGTVFSGQQPNPAAAQVETEMNAAQEGNGLTDMPWFDALRRGVTGGVAGPKSVHSFSPVGDGSRGGHAALPMPPDSVPRDKRMEWALNGGKLPALPQEMVLTTPMEDKAFTAVVNWHLNTMTPAQKADFLSWVNTNPNAKQGQIQQKLANVIKTR